MKRSRRVKSIESITDLDEADFIIKWRMTEMCNADCSYCIRKRHHKKVDRELLALQNSQLCGVAKSISRMVESTEFSNVKIDMIGGEVSVLDLPEITRNLASPKIRQINMTTNLLRDTEYYKSLCGSLHSRGVKATAVASFHYEFISFDKYFEKIEHLRDCFDILACEIVSNEDNQPLCGKFIEKCREIGIDYMCEGDLRFNEIEARQSGLIVESRKHQKPDRYSVLFSDGTSRVYTSRNQLLMDGEIAENRWQKAIHTKGYICSNSHDFVYIDFDTVVGRALTGDSCTNRVPVGEFRIVEPRPCPFQNCTLCGHMSLHRDSGNNS